MVPARIRAKHDDGAMVYTYPARYADSKGHIGRMWCGALASLYPHHVGEDAFIHIVLHDLRGYVHVNDIEIKRLEPTATELANAVYGDGSKVA